MKNYKAKLDKINTFIFDFDGVLSDGMVLLTENGDFLRRTNVKDGYAIQFAIKKGFRIAIISGAKGKGMEKRLFGLNIEDIYLGVPDKLVAYNNLKEKYNLQDENILYMGDDIPDINVMKQVAVACCPADADSEVKKLVIIYPIKKVEKVVLEILLNKHLDFTNFG